MGNALPASKNRPLTRTTTMVPALPPIVGGADVPADDGPAAAAAGAAASASTGTRTYPPAGAIVHSPLGKDALAERRALVCGDEGSTALGARFKAKNRAYVLSAGAGPASIEDLLNKLDLNVGPSTEHSYGRGGTKHSQMYARLQLIRRVANGAFPDEESGRTTAEPGAAEVLDMLLDLAAYNDSDVEVVLHGWEAVTTQAAALAAARDKFGAERRGVVEYSLSPLEEAVAGFKQQVLDLQR